MEDTIESLRAERDKLKIICAQHDKELKEVFAIVYDVLDFVGLLNPEKNNINPKYMVEGTNNALLQDMINALMSIGLEYKRLHGNDAKYLELAIGTEEFNKQLALWNKKISFTWRVVDIFNNHAAKFNMNKVELEIVK